MIKIQEGCPTAEAWLTLRRAVGFAPYPLEAAERGLQHTLKCFCALDQEDRMVGLVKLQGDGVTSFLVHDLIVLPAWQGKGVGGMLLERALEYIRASRTPGASVCLLSAAGKEPFYEKYGFRRRPGNGKGCGMALDD